MSPLEARAGLAWLKRRGPKASRVLRFATFLAPNLYSFYAFVAWHLGTRCGFTAELFPGTRYEQLDGQADVAFLCGLPYVERSLEWEPLAAPVLQGDRYRGRPVYYSDVIVRRDSPFRSFADLRGCTWAYNERLSHSGYGVVCYRLAELGELNGYFGRVVESGWHEESIRMVHAGRVDASAIDSHVLSIALRNNSQLHSGLRVIASLGPSSIQPVVAKRHLPGRLKLELGKALTRMHQDAAAKPHLEQALVQRFVPVTDATYEDIRQMRAAGKKVSLENPMMQTATPHSLMS